jgi:molybdate transport system substrate-binding protein
MRRAVCILAVIVCVLLTMTISHAAEENLMVFCGAAFRLPVEEIVQAFAKQAGKEPYVTYAGVGTLFSQIVLGKRGDVFIVPSPDIMEKARARELILPGSIRSMGYVVPAINVQKGNPRNIRNLRDMVRPGIRLGFANPEIVFVGLLAAEIVDKSLNPQERGLFRKNIVTYAEDFSKLASLLILKQVDAVIGFSYLSAWYPDKIETVRLNPDEVRRIGVGQAAMLSYSKSTAQAEKFLEFLASRESQAIFKKYHYFSTLEEAASWLGAKKPVGGDYRLTTDWTGH